MTIPLDFKGVNRPVVIFLCFLLFMCHLGVFGLLGWQAVLWLEWIMIVVFAIWWTKFRDHNCFTPSIIKTVAPIERMELDEETQQMVPVRYIAIILNPPMPTPAEDTQC